MDVPVSCINCSDCVKMEQVGTISTLESVRWTGHERAHGSRYFLTFTKLEERDTMTLPMVGWGRGERQREVCPCVCVSVCECIRVYTCVCLCACELCFLSSGWANYPSAQFFFV